VRSLAVVVVLAAAPSAFAQAPGQTAAPSAPASSVIENPWAVALGLVSEGLKPEVSAGSNVQFAGLELAGRYRFRPTMEVALSLSVAGSKGDLGTGGLFADFRYHFRAEERWNFYALAGLGVVQAGSKNGTDMEKKGRGALHLGGGGEVRFGHVAVFAELTLLGVAPNTEVPDQSLSTAYLLERYGLSGGSLALGATYYF
jgi:hypothetical protein